ncbi:alpha/beta hydrolase [Longispora urticae]
MTATPMFLRTGTDRLLAMVDTPDGPPSGYGVVLLPGAATPGFGNARIWARVGAALAAHGHVAARLDFRGMGESSGGEQPISLADPFPDDVLACVDLLRDAGADRVVLMGTCFGARSAMAAAPRVPGLAGLTLMFPPLQFADPDAETDDHFTAALAGAVGTGVPVRILYGTLDMDLPRFRAVCPPDGPLSGAPNVRIDIVPGRLHGVADPDADAAVLRAALDTAAEFTATGRAAASSARGV